MPKNSSQLTPATLFSESSSVSSVSASVPRARGQAPKEDAELLERERGNTAFNAGDFNSAVKCYTKCIGMKVKLVPPFHALMSLLNFF